MDQMENNHQGGGLVQEKHGKPGTEAEVDGARLSLVICFETGCVKTFVGVVPQSRIRNQNTNKEQPGKGLKRTDKVFLFPL
jgi:hypothetical protein